MSLQTWHNHSNCLSTMTDGGAYVYDAEDKRKI